MRKNERTTTVATSLRKKALGKKASNKLLLVKFKTHKVVSALGFTLQQQGEVG